MTETQIVGLVRIVTDLRHSCREMDRFVRRNATLICVGSVVHDSDESGFGWPGWKDLVAVAGMAGAGRGPETRHAAGLRLWDERMLRLLREQEHRRVRDLPAARATVDLARQAVGPAGMHPTGVPLEFTAVLVLTFPR
jgi:hypothetical protein